MVISKISTITANWPISSKVKYNVKTYQSFNIDFKQNNIVSKGIRVGQISTDKIVFQYKERTNGTRAEYYPICGLDNGTLRHYYEPKEDSYDSKSYGFYDSIQFVDKTNLMYNLCRKDA